MTLAPLWRTRLFAAAGVLAAIWTAFAVAREELLLPMVLLGGAGLLVLTWVQLLPVPTLLLGTILVGYIAGNRGFAQLYLSPTVPLLPAEFVLLVGGSALAIRSALQRQLPFRTDVLGIILLAWGLYALFRLVSDFRAYSFQALRDSAMVYYAVFFFLARHAGKEPAARRFLLRSILTGCTLLLFLQLPYRQFPEFFLGTLTFRGNPVIFFKGDLVGVFLAVAAVLLYLKAEGERTVWPLVASLVFSAATLGTNNRAAMLGLAVATALLAIGGRWRFAVWQAGAGVVAAVAVLLVARIADIPLEQTPVYGFYERVVSVVDPGGQREYLSADAADKGDNNQFRAVWWRAVFDETLAGNPYTGLGFGHDLAERFVRDYYPDAGDEFNTRSPHNYLLTVFARMGAAGLLPLLAVIALMLVRTLRAVRDRTSESAGLWLGAWVILISACFGVVLEGPMGAVVFWTMLGLACAAEDSPEGLEDAPAATDSRAGRVEETPEIRTPNVQR